ncbi:hypothetical protein BLNAU_15090 [Blattamonas nauphoetae]|uniref:Uncharacterized protein n=1 Tax=Blattamonas nauphoetae TaxID=2049346 RepID=A0ABQ9XBS3_9EUKA|nr:hypothetical protein BLNAU_15090 [Blattamonas nauphoetae]
MVLLKIHTVGQPLKIMVIKGTETFGGNKGVIQTKLGLSSMDNLILHVENEDGSLGQRIDWDGDTPDSVGISKAGTKLVLVSESTNIPLQLSSLTESLVPSGPTTDQTPLPSLTHPLDTVSPRQPSPLLQEVSIPDKPTLRETPSTPPLSPSSPPPSTHTDTIPTASPQLIVNAADPPTLPPRRTSLSQLNSSHTAFSPTRSPKGQSSLSPSLLPPSPPFHPHSTLHSTHESRSVREGLSEVTPKRQTQQLLKRSSKQDEKKGRRADHEYSSSRAEMAGNTRPKTSCAVKGRKGQNGRPHSPNHQHPTSRHTSTKHPPKPRKQDRPSFVSRSPERDRHDRMLLHSIFHSLLRSSSPPTRTRHWQNTTESETHLRRHDKTERKYQKSLSSSSLDSDTEKQRNRRKGHRKHSQRRKISNSQTQTDGGQSEEFPVAQHQFENDTIRSDSHEPSLPRRSACRDNDVSALLEKDENISKFLHSLGIEPPFPSWLGPLLLRLTERPNGEKKSSTGRDGECGDDTDECSVSPVPGHQNDDSKHKSRPDSLLSTQTAEHKQSQRENTTQAKLDELIGLLNTFLSLTSNSLSDSFSPSSSLSFDSTRLSRAQQHSHPTLTEYGLAAEPSHRVPLTSPFFFAHIPFPAVLPIFADLSSSTRLVCSRIGAKTAQHTSNVTAFCRRLVWPVDSLGTACPSSPFLHSLPFPTFPPSAPASAFPRFPFDCLPSSGSCFIF